MSSAYNTVCVRPARDEAVDPFPAASFPGRKKGPGGCPAAFKGGCQQLVFGLRGPRKVPTARCSLECRLGKTSSPVLGGVPRLGGPKRHEFGMNTADFGNARETTFRACSRKARTHAAGHGSSRRRSSSRAFVHCSWPSGDSRRWITSRRARERRHPRDAARPRPGRGSADERGDHLADHGALRTVEARRAPDRRRRPTERSVRGARAPQSPHRSTTCAVISNVLGGFSPRPRV